MLQGLEIWTPPSAGIVLVSPHPDDETLATGGFIAEQRQRGVEIQVVAVTDGEMAYTVNEGLGALRTEEQTQALERLGVPSTHIHRLHITDSSVGLYEEQLRAALLSLVTPETHLVAPWKGDFHPDHEACGRVAEQVAAQTGARLTSYFFWTWHRGEPETLAGALRAGVLRRYPLRPESVRAKQEALECHRSQLAWPYEAPILPADLLGPAQRSFEVFLVEPRGHNEQ